MSEPRLACFCIKNVNNISQSCLLFCWFFLKVKMWRERRPCPAGKTWVSSMTHGRAPETEVAREAAPPALHGRAQQAGRHRQGPQLSSMIGSHHIPAQFKMWPAAAEANPLTLLLCLQTLGICIGDFLTLGSDVDFNADNVSGRICRNSVCNRFSTFHIYNTVFYSSVLNIILKHFLHHVLSQLH